MHEEPINSETWTWTWFLFCPYFICGVTTHELLGIEADIVFCNIFVVTIGGAFEGPHNFVLSLIKPFSILCSLAQKWDIFFFKDTCNMLNSPYKFIIQWLFHKNSYYFYCVIKKNKKRATTFIENDYSFRNAF